MATVEGRGQRRTGIEDLGKVLLENLGKTGNLLTGVTIGKLGEVSYVEFTFPFLASEKRAKAMTVVARSDPHHW